MDSTQIGRLTIISLIIKLNIESNTLISSQSKKVSIVSFRSPRMIIVSGICSKGGNHMLDVNNERRAVSFQLI